MTPCHVLAECVEGGCGLRFTCTPCILGRNRICAPHSARSPRLRSNRHVPGHWVAVTGVRCRWGRGGFIPCFPRHFCIPKLHGIWQHVLFLKKNVYVFLRMPPVDVQYRTIGVVALFPDRDIFCLLCWTCVHLRRIFLSIVSMDIGTEEIVRLSDGSSGGLARSFDHVGQRRPQSLRIVFQMDVVATSMYAYSLGHTHSLGHAHSLVVCPHPR